MSQDQNTSPTLNSTDIINIFKSMPGHIYWKDRDGYYLGCNEQQAIDLGLANSDAIIGKTDYDLLPQEEAERIRRLWTP